MLSSIHERSRRAGVKYSKLSYLAVLHLLFVLNLDQISCVCAGAFSPGPRISVPVCPQAWPDQRHHARAGHPPGSGPRLPGAAPASFLRGEHCGHASGRFPGQLQRQTEREACPLASSHSQQSVSHARWIQSYFLLMKCHLWYNLTITSRFRA